jgi:hypothetical protein
MQVTNIDKLADSMKLSLCMILNWKSVPKLELPVGLIIRCQTTGWMTKLIDGSWLQFAWNRKLRVLLRTQGMLVLNVFKVI